MNTSAQVGGTHVTPRKIIGFSMAPQMAADLKMEAAKRGISLRQLLEEMWSLYKAKKLA